MIIKRYGDLDKNLWDTFVAESKNGHFMFYRNYMEYHKSRFKDHSLIIYDNKNNVVGLLPAHEKETDFSSHQGLTYGGVITQASMKLPLMLEVFKSIEDYLITNHFKQFIYKTVPHIYHQLPAEEDLCALFCAKASLYRRNIFSVVKCDSEVPWQERRLRSIKKAFKAGLEVKFSLDFASYWTILNETLKLVHGTSPVHSLEEITSLQKLFPENIKLFGCFLKGTMIAGVVIYETNRVARSQYIAASNQGKELGALDLIFECLLQEIYKSKVYFDLGPSDQQDGYDLNEGLIDQKEGFGARSIAHDHYRMELKKK